MVSYFLLYPDAYSLSAITAAQASSDSFEYALYSLWHVDEELKRSIRRVRGVYANLDSLKVEKGEVDYPHEKCDPAGMAFELRFAPLDITLKLAYRHLRNLNFAYPGSDEGSSQRLKDVSLAIPAGGVVLVGTNGSGKSTFIKLLAGLYRPDSGTIVIDGHPSTSYVLAPRSARHRFSCLKITNYSPCPSRRTLVWGGC